MAVERERRARLFKEKRHDKDNASRLTLDGRLGQPAQLLRRLGEGCALLRHVRLECDAKLIHALVEALELLALLLGQVQTVAPHGADHLLDVPQPLAGQRGRIRSEARVESLKHVHAHRALDIEICQLLESVAAGIAYAPVHRHVLRAE